MQRYLESSKYINWKNASVLQKAEELSHASDDSLDLAKKCFEYVRDEIKHSWDFQLNPVTCKASEVLHYKTGYCFAKSHLLAALLRANRIPAGLCYQRLSLNQESGEFCLHGLNAIHFDEFGWYKVDARGDKQGVNTAFNPPHEKLAFALSTDGESNLPEIYSKPLGGVVNVLSSCSTFAEVNSRLPDI